MADDGLLLNFAIDNSIIKPEAKFKGGTWRDRLSAKKRSQRRPGVGGDASKRNESKNPNKIQVPATRPTKRQRTDSEAPVHNADRRPRTQPQSSHQHPRQFVSSLFTSNPEPVNAEEPRSEEIADDAKPTNAPLIDGLDTFTNLGLSPNLAAHLLTKLELKAPTAIQKASITQ